MNTPKWNFLAAISMVVVTVSFMLIGSMHFLSVIGISKLPLDALVFLDQVVFLPMMGVGLVGLILSGQARREFQALAGKPSGLFVYLDPHEDLRQ